MPTVIAIFAAIFFALGQFYLDTVMFAAVFTAKAIKALLPLMLKMLCYGIAFWLLFKLFKAFIVAAAIGFGIGFFPSILIYGFYKLRKN